MSEFPSVRWDRLRSLFLGKPPKRRRQTLHVPLPLHERRERGHTVADKVVREPQDGQVHVRVVPVADHEADLPLPEVLLELVDHRVVVRGDEDLRLEALLGDLLERTADLAHDDVQRRLAHLCGELAVLAAVAEALRSGEQRGRRGDVFACPGLKEKLI